MPQATENAELQEWGEKIIKHGKSEHKTHRRSYKFVVSHYDDYVRMSLRMSAGNLDRSAEFKCFIGYIKAVIKAEESRTSEDFTMAHDEPSIPQRASADAEAIREPSIPCAESIPRASIHAEAMRVPSTDDEIRQIILENLAMRDETIAQLTQASIQHDKEIDKLKKEIQALKERLSQG